MIVGMSLQALIKIIHSGKTEGWSKDNEAAFQSLFGSPGGRYPQPARDKVTLRAPEIPAESGVPFAAFIHPSNPTSGAYSGLSFVMFPVPEQPCLIGMVVGTQGLSPDEAILGRPGHARKMRAICAWLNSEFGKGTQVAWAKQDPTRVDLNIPKEVRQKWPAYHAVFDRYGPVLYALFKPNGEVSATQAALTAFLDVMFEERGHAPLTNFKDDAETIRTAWFEHLMATVTREQITSLLKQRRYVILQGPPGTGKTRMAREILRTEYASFGRSIQFHPNVTYENFIGGLHPVSSAGELGFRFAPKPGLLMEAAVQALEQPDRDFLLHIDEINRADLGKILGEAIYLLEPEPEFKRQIELPYDFGEPFHRCLFLPDNLHVLGTMNSADRSIAIVDIAVRRRFAFVSLWPGMRVVEQHGCPTMQKAFRELVSIFVEHAPDEAFPLVPGHSYFLEPDESRAAQNLRVNLAPLLDEYLAQGYVSGFAESVRNYLQWLRSL
jgi:5-methylcytosine-specific restriction protein B